MHNDRALFDVCSSFGVPSISIRVYYLNLLYYMQLDVVESGGAQSNFGLLLVLISLEQKLYGNSCYNFHKRMFSHWEYNGGSMDL